MASVEGLRLGAEAQAAEAADLQLGVRVSPSREGTITTKHRR